MNVELSYSIQMMLFSDINLVPGWGLWYYDSGQFEALFFFFSFLLSVLTMVLNILKEANIIKDSISNPDHS